MTKTAEIIETIIIWHTNSSYILFKWHLFDLRHGYRQGKSHWKSFKKYEKHYNPGSFFYVRKQKLRHNATPLKIKSQFNVIFTFCSIFPFMS